MFDRIAHAAARLIVPGTIKRVANTPLFVMPDVARDTLAYLLGRHGMKSTGLPSMSTVEDIPDAPNVNKALRVATNMRGARRDNGKVFHQNNAVAVIPVEGTLVHKYGTVDPACGMTGYDGIEAKITAALTDPSVRGILLDIDSPGGEVAGCFGLADFIQAARDQKPIWAMVDEMACSAAYALAASCSRVYMTDTGNVGSVGVVMLHADYSKMLSDEGIKVTLIHSGAHKVDGNPYEPLPDDVQAEIQAELDTLRQRFAETVAVGRGIDVKAVLDTEARVLMASEALSIGFADGVLPARIAVQTFLDDIGGVSSAPRYSAVKSAAATAEAAPPKPQEDSMPEDNGAAVIAATNTATVNATKAANERFAAIMALPEAKGRDQLALSLATTTDLTVEQVAAQLKAAPTAAVQSPLGAAMATIGNTEVGAAAPARTVEAVAIDTAGIYAARARAMGQTA